MQGPAGKRETRPPGFWLRLRAELAGASWSRPWASRPQRTGYSRRGRRPLQEEGVMGAGPRAGPGFRIQPEPAEPGLFILGRKAGAGGGGGSEAFSKNNNNKNAHLEGSQDVLNSKSVLEKMLRRFKCKWTQNIIIKFPLNLPEFGVKEKIKLRENTLEVSGKCQVLRKIDF